MLPHLYASILAHACNFGLEQMAHVTDMAYDQLAWCTTWYMRRTHSRPRYASGQYYHHNI